MAQAGIDKAILQADVKGMTTREAITDAIYRCILGIDSHDESLFASAMFSSPETHFTIAGGPITQGSEAILTYMREHIFPLTTLHQITNVRVVDLDEAKGTARISAHAVAHHYKPEDAYKPERLSFVTGAIYDIEVVRDDADQGLWKVKGWILHLLWTEGDQRIVFG